MLWWPGHRPTHSFGGCSPASRRVAPLRPRYAGLSALTTAPRTPVQTGSYRTMPNSDPLHVVVDDLSRFRRSEATVDSQDRPAPGAAIGRRGWRETASAWPERLASNGNFAIGRGQQRAADRHRCSSGSGSEIIRGLAAGQHDEVSTTTSPTTATASGTASPTTDTSTGSRTTSSPPPLRRIAPRVCRSRACSMPALRPVGGRAGCTPFRGYDCVP